MVVYPSQLSYVLACLSPRVSRFHRRIGFKLYLAPAHTMVGFSHFAVNDQEQALMHFESGKVIAQETGAQYPLAEALFWLGLVQERNGNFDAAVKYYKRALTVSRPINLRPVIQAATTRIDELSKHTGQAGLPPMNPTWLVGLRSIGTFALSVDLVAKQALHGSTRQDMQPLEHKREVLK